MEVRLSNASAATVEACLYNKELNKEFWVRGTIGGDLTTTDGKPANIFYFSVPKLLNGVENDTSGYQDGNWQITKVRIIDGAFSAAEQYSRQTPVFLVGRCSRTSGWTPEARSRICVCRASFLMTFVQSGMLWPSALLAS